MLSLLKEFFGLTSWESGFRGGRDFGLKRAIQIIQGFEIGEFNRAYRNRLVAEIRKELDV